MISDLARLAAGAILANRLRSFLTTLGIVVGITSVTLLTGLGEGTRQYVVAQFSQFGTNFVQIAPGKAETRGMPGLSTTRPVTVDDALALLRVPGVRRVVPAVYGLARVELGDRGRNVFIYGVTADVPEVWKFDVEYGQFLPAGDPRHAASVAVLGPTLARELFRGESPLGNYVRIGGRRVLVIGVMAPKGQMLGFDIDDAAYIPVASARSLFNRENLDEVHILLGPGSVPAVVVEGMRRTLLTRHDNEEDFTITTQTEMLDVLDRILGSVSLAIVGIAAISLLVGAIGIVTIMWIAVTERTSEIGLSIAVGATPRQMRVLFLLESMILAGCGGVVGVVLGVGVGALVQRFVPGLPFSMSPGLMAIAVCVSLAAGLASGVLPARRAASLDPVEALRAE